MHGGGIHGVGSGRRMRMPATKGERREHGQRGEGVAATSVVAGMPPRQFAHGAAVFRLCLWIFENTVLTFESLSLKVCASIFPVTDKRHRVVTSLNLLLGEVVSKSPLLSSYDLVVGVLSAGLLLESTVEAKRMARGMARLKYLLLMAARMLAIAALIFAMSRPWVGGWLGALSGDDADVTIIVLDRSVSMEEQDAQSQVSKREMKLRD